MDWRGALVLALIFPAISQVSTIPFASLKPDATIPVELERGSHVAADGIWIPQRRTPGVVRVNARNNSPDQPIALPKAPCGSVVLAAEALWTGLCDLGTLARIEVKNGNVSASVPLPLAEPAGTLAVASHSLWAISDAKGVVTRIDYEANTPVAEVYVAGKPFAVAADEGAVWVTSEDGNILTRINAQTNVVVEAIQVGPRPGFIAIGEGAVWTLNRGDGSVSRVDPGSNKVVHTIAVGADIADGTIAAGEGAVWISARGVPLVRIDPRTNRVTHRFTGEGGGAVVVGHGSVWVNAAVHTSWRLDPKLVAAMRP